MKIREKIKKYYAKMGIKVDDKTLNVILEDKERTNNIIRLYKQEEMETMNYILGKDKDNKIFTKFELEAVNKIDLFNRKVVEVCKVIWANEMLGGAN